MCEEETAVETTNADQNKNKNSEFEAIEQKLSSVWI